MEAEGAGVMEEQRTISLNDLVNDLYTMQQRMGARNTHKSTVQTAILALLSQAKIIADLKKAAPEPQPLVQL